MWIALAAVWFLLILLYLNRCMGKLDTFLESRNAPEQRVILTVALSDPGMKSQLSHLLEAYCIAHPEVEPVLLLDAETPEAVREKRADAGICREEEIPAGLNCLSLALPKGGRGQLIWKDDRIAGEFAEFLHQACRK